MSLTCPSPQVVSKTQTAGFSISGRSLINEKCHNSRTSNDTDMKFGPVTKLDIRKVPMSKKLDDNVMSANYDIIVHFSISCQFGAIQKPEIFYLTKIKNRIKKSLTQLSCYCFEWRYCCCYFYFMNRGFQKFYNFIFSCF